MRRSSTQQVYQVVVEALEQRIGAGDWQVGQRLPSIAALAEELGVSTSPVREAVRVMAARGLLRIEHGRGMFVTEPPGGAADLHHYFQSADSGSLLALFEVRRLIEPEVAALAAERGSDDDLRAIGMLASAMERAVAAGQSFTDPDIMFHERIAVAAKNGILAAIMSSLHDRILEGSKVTRALPGMTPRAVRYHLLIADAIRERNPLQARLLMLAHVNDAIDALLKETADQTSAASQVSPMIVSQRSLRPG